MNTIPDHYALSRRTMLRGAALLGAGSLLGGRAFAQGTGIEGEWPAVTALVERYVKSRKVAGM
ncbi:MAG TPA: hypothetical protein PLL44_05415, partial [Novosphingobium sp.]|nr:hypothetical protein [Novosphingobium sp.]